MVTRVRESVFDDFFAARHLSQVMRASDRYGLTQMLCFVVMPDHLHWMMN
ncbi:MAG: hypothetical protein JZU50_08460 [Desulfobulbaceae bacterium]|nr:hypothetical protein [Desulfobulbaceae bacterium]